MQAVEQVFTETAGLRVNDQVSIRGRDDPHIDLQPLPPAYRLRLCFFAGLAKFFCTGPGNSPTSPRNNVPPLASTNLLLCFSVAPVKTSFSYPNRVDSTKFSGRARQLTATKGFVRRAPLPWIARAINFFPTPDSPSIKTGLTDAAAFAAALRTGSIAGERLITSAMVSVPSCLRLSRCNSPASTLVASALRSETCKRSAFAGLTTKSVAPARRAGNHIIDPTMRGLYDHRDGQPGLAHPRQHVKPIEIGHHQIEHHGVNALCFGARQELDCCNAAFGDHWLIAETLDHCFEQATLNRIVVGDEHNFGTWPPTRSCAKLMHCRRSRLMGY